MHTHYDILKVSSASSVEEIHEAYEKAKASILAFAPGVELSESDMERLFPLLWEARVVLGNPVSRRDYDLSLVLVGSEDQPAEILLPEEISVPRSLSRTIMGYSGFMLMMALFVFFLYYLAGYIL